MPSTESVQPSIQFPNIPPEFQRLVEEMQHATGSLLHPETVDDRPLHGTTLYVATCSLDTRFGPFRTHIFQDIIDKHYIIALAFGDITKAEVIYTRLHSSCVTSETLRGCDCDCVQQLEGAFKVIAEKGSGILFYLMQEGRGVGYIGKSRDRMMVQASLDQLSTFQAYASMGLKKDHRNYDNISDIYRLLGITAPFIVLTNNPDKVNALRDQGIEVVDTETLEFEPSPFNLAYLTSKAASGHILNRPSATRVKRALPPEPVVPFKPHALPAAKRFIYSASYFLPMKPVDDDVLLNAEEFQSIFGEKKIEDYIAEENPLVTNYQLIRGNRFLVRIHAKNLKAYQDAHPDDPIVDLLTTPYWFRVHVYYDIVTSQEFVILTHGKARIYDIPVVRLHSESLFNRFPLRTVENRDKFKQSVKHIIHYGVGVIQLLYNDGRGAGFGAYATDLMLSETGMALSSDEAYRRIGVGYDSRDYEASVSLLKQHVPNLKIQMVMNSPSSLVKKPEYAEALQHHRLDVERWIFLDDESLSD
ncbi:GTP cyclohydrolase [Synoicihabitans lomoniglobus]|uniref:GTP cyclohydrolase n=1 Tax=Synoicihabitans lomoniglobus TaxID=2909285 RepID=A0AAF0CS91_9BACT|nr:GTP cyclohydrolase [Opitutaceae bacterium LMO-M01]WED67157.1 GTP cyclohydrolase [Opitutaceae bacterium LMO-M01]